MHLAERVPAHARRQAHLMHRVRARLFHELCELQKALAKMRLHPAVRLARPQLQDRLRRRRVHDGAKNLRVGGLLRASIAVHWHAPWKRGPTHRAWPSHHTAAACWHAPHATTTDGGGGPHHGGTLHLHHALPLGKHCLTLEHRCTSRHAAAAAKPTAPAEHGAVHRPDTAERHGMHPHGAADALKSHATHSTRPGPHARSETCIIAVATVKTTLRTICCRVTANRPQ